MEQFDVITQFLGLQNIEELKSGMKDLILKRFKEDLESYDMYLFDFDKIETIIIEIYKEAKEEVKEALKNKIMYELEEQLSKKL